jgi:hypothetical protein
VGALIVAIVCTTVGAGIGAFAAGRLELASAPGDQQGIRIARGAVSLLGAFAGGEIAVQLYTLIHSLQLNAELDKGFGGRLLHDVNLADVVQALHGVMFYGALLAGLAVALAILASNRRAQPSEPVVPPPLSS